MYLILVGVPIAAIGLTIAACANLKLIDAGVGLLGRRFARTQAALRPPLAFLSRRPLRTGLATSAFALVIVMVTVIAVAVSGSNVDYQRDSAGYDIQVVTQSSDPIVLPADVAQQVTAETVIPMRHYRGPLTAPGIFGGSGTSVDVMFYVLPEQPQDAGPVYLTSREKRFGSDADVWRALRAEPGLVVGEWSSSVNTGDAITVEGANGPIDLHLAAIPASTILNGLIASPSTLARIDASPAGSTVLLKTRPGVNQKAMAREIERALFTQGVQATSTREVLDQDYATNLNYATEYDVLLHMGLVVGVLALAMVSARAAVERRRVIGVLRSLGYHPSRVMAGLVVESVVMTTLGAVSGIFAGLIMGYLVIGGSQPGTNFGVDFARLGIALAIVYVTVMIVTGPLAWRVSRLAPTEAIRMSA
jgi:putative ABC transport system permease protein